MATKLTKTTLEKISNLIKTFDFKTLFHQLGWDSANFSKTILIKENQHLLTAIAEKRGFVIFTCQALDFPNQAERKKIAQQIGTLYQEHIIIYFNAEKQIWQISVKELNKPIQYKETEYYSHQEPKLLLSRLRGIFFTLDEEENIHLVDVTDRVKSNFNTNTEKTTKKFYDDFKSQHKAFMLFIKGLENEENKRWYASLMLNRLMFIYFIQKKGFLDNDIHYLRNKLVEVKAKNGGDKFYSFYRTFLLQFFHHGLGEEHKDNKELIALIGKIPYLNGGLFDVHELELEENSIEIPDEAFDKLFNFFDKYQWHLDTNISAKGDEINPDVIGYIFEKYINDRAAMGAYYTKEDITEYISKNTIIPFLFDKAKKECANAFKSESSLWQLLKDSPDRYIYEAVKKGCDYTDIPEAIAIGIDNTAPDLLARRKEWNTPTPEKFGLPTEIWRETIARRQRYFELKAKLEQGEITELNDFITYNLNIRQFAQDALEFYEGSDFIEAFYHAIIEITVLDPTCGSGAFLFAALNILEPLYEGCINRMREFVENAKPDKFKNFRVVLADIDTHANPTYWIYKKIILNNLYGVDIMQEAVEIAKLRLFLKLAAMSEVDYKKPNMGLEPLPDIDFNIRCGNSLVGFSSFDEFEKQASQQIFYSSEKDRITKKLGYAKQSFKEFDKCQNEGLDFHKEKKAYKSCLLSLQTEMNRYLAIQYGFDGNNFNGLESFRLSHKPFHWFAEFYDIIHEKFGFDVIIGNPPYVEYSKVKNYYLIKNYETESCGNLYANVIELSSRINKSFGKIGMIVQLPIVCTDRMTKLQNIVINNRTTWFANFDDRPSRLFEGLEHIRATIFITQNNNSLSSSTFSTTYNRWYSESRQYLLEIQSFEHIENHLIKSSVLKIGDTIGKSVFKKVIWLKKLNYFLTKKNKFICHFHNAPQYWVRTMNFVPYFWNEREGEKISVQVKPLYVATQNEVNVLVAMLNSSLFYWWFIIFSDCRHLNLREIDNFPVGFEQMSNDIKKQLKLLTDRLMIDFKNNAQRKECFYKTTGSVIYDEFDVKKSKPIIDEIDKVLAEHYGFTEEELDFIINYDIKYRMGKELD